MKKKINYILRKGRSVGCIVLAGNFDKLNNLEKVGTLVKVGTNRHSLEK